MSMLEALAVGAVFLIVYLAFVVFLIGVVGGP